MIDKMKFEVDPADGALMQSFDGERFKVLSSTDDISDGYHTFSELYQYRMVYNAHLFNMWAKYGEYPVYKSWNHSDGEKCFGGGWFIVVAELPTGQVSNHYKAKYWSLFNITNVDIPPVYDGHTPAEAAQRLMDLLGQNEVAVNVNDCATCGEGDGNKCFASQRKCGHHCNHVWTHEKCCWCNVEFGED